MNRGTTRALILACAILFAVFSFTSLTQSFGLDAGGIAGLLALILVFTGVYFVIAYATTWFVRKALGWFYPDGAGAVDRAGIVFVALLTAGESAMVGYGSREALLLAFPAVMPVVYIAVSMIWMKYWTRNR